MIVDITPSGQLREIARKLGQARQDAATEFVRIKLLDPKITDGYARAQVEVEFARLLVELEAEYEIAAAALVNDPVY